MEKNNIDTDDDTPACYFPKGHCTHTDLSLVILAVQNNPLHRSNAWKIGYVLVTAFTMLPLMRSGIYWPSPPQRAVWTISHVKPPLTEKATFRCHLCRQSGHMTRTGLLFVWQSFDVVRDHTGCRHLLCTCTFSRKYPLLEESAFIVCKDHFSVQVKPRNLKLTFRGGWQEKCPIREESQVCHIICLTLLRTINSSMSTLGCGSAWWPKPLNDGLLS